MEKNVQSLKRMKKIIYPLIVIILIILILMTNKTSAPVIINKTGNFDILEEKDIVLIDVRSKEEYNEGHIEKAINIPYNELQDKIHYHLKTKIAEVGNIEYKEVRNMKGVGDRLAPLLIA